MSKSAITEPHAVAARLMRTLRKKRGISQTDLAEKLGKSQQFVSYIETGLRRVDLVEFIVILRALEENPEEVFAAFLDGVPPDVSI